MINFKERDKEITSKIKYSNKITIFVTEFDGDLIVNADFEIKDDHKKYRRYFSNLTDCLDTIKKLIIEI